MLERRNAAKHIDYDAASSSSSLEDSTSSSLHTRSLDLTDRTSFRVGGNDGDIDVICRKLGLSGPEEFEIPAVEWDALKIRSSSDVLPRWGALDLESPKREDVKYTAESEAVAELRVRVVDGTRIGHVAELTRADPAELTGFSLSGGCDSGVGGSGIKGIRPPPVLKPPPAMRLPVIDDACSTWDLLKDLAPDAEKGLLGIFHGGHSSSDEEVEKDEEEEEEVEVEREKGKVENVISVGEMAALSESGSFTTSNDDDCSSSSTERMSNISPNGRVRPSITCWEKGELLGRGSFGSVYEGISQ